MRLRWLVLASMLGCTPSGPPVALELDELAPQPPLAIAVDEHPQIETRCGELVSTSISEWRTRDPFLQQLQDAWDPRGTDGKPIAMRLVSSPTQLDGHTPLQVSLRGGPRDVITCYVASPPDLYEVCASPEFALMMLQEHAERPRPSTARGWAELLGMLDSASAVFDGNDELARCVPGLPQPVAARVPELGMRVGERTEIAFVERLDPTPELTMLVVVRATIGAGMSTLTREELLTVDREAR